MFDSVARCYYNRGLQEALGKNITGAVKNLSKAIEYDNKYIGSWNLLGLCYYRLGKFGMAQHSWAQSLEIQRNENPAQLYWDALSDNLREVGPVFKSLSELNSKKEYKKATDVFENKILVPFGSCVEVLNYYGGLKSLEGERVKAVEIWEKVLSIDCLNEKASRYIADLTRKNESRGSVFERLMFWKRR